METRVALIGIIVTQESSVAALNDREKGVNIISVVLDAPQDAISALSGKIGRLEGVSAKTQYSHVITPGEN